MLLSGSVIGGVEDLGAVYYNPGRLGLIENPAFLLSANVYQWQKVKIEDALGESVNLSKSDFGTVPSLVAGSFTVKFLEGHRFSYALLQRQHIDLDFNYENEIYADIFEDLPGKEYFRGSISLNSRYKEEWATLTWSYPFAEKWSIGVATNFLMARVNRGDKIEMQALTDAKKTAMLAYDRNYKFSRFGLLWKLGLAAEFEKSWWGLTLTTPVIGFGGKGDYQFEEFYSGIDGTSQEGDIFTTTDQEDLPVKLRQPWAIGLGATFRVNRNKIHLSGEWYSKIPFYALLESDSHVSQSSGMNYQFTLYDDLNSVLNGGIGLEFYIKDKISLYGSFSTDFSAVKSDRISFTDMAGIASNSTTTADYYHFGGGVILKLKGLDLTLGATRTGSKEPFYPPLEFPEEGDDGIFDPDETGTLKWSRWRLVFAFSVPFLEQSLERIKEDF